MLSQGYRGLYTQNGSVTPKKLVKISFSFDIQVILDKSAT